MDIDEIKALTDLMVENDLSEVMIRDGEKRIVIRRGAQPYAHPPAFPAHAPAPPMSAQATTGVSPPTSPAIDVGLSTIKSPMVGTFYSAPSPEAPPYVKIGDRVGPESVVCIIEAMKVFNEIKAEVSGIIESIEIQSGKPVEFGQVLMTVRSTG